jgi:hypothetical protein
MQSPNILAGSTCNYWQTTSVCYIRGGLLGKGHKIGDTEILVGFNNVQKMMGNQHPFPGRWLGSTDVHIPVYLAAIGADNLPAKTSG